MWLSRNHTVSLQILRILATDDDVLVRRVVAQNEHLDEQLSNDESKAVRAMLPGNLACPRPTFSAEWPPTTPGKA